MTALHHLVIIGRRHRGGLVEVAECNIMTGRPTWYVVRILDLWRLLCLHRPAIVYHNGRFYKMEAPNVDRER